jgi:hypothetical protein
VKWRLFELYTFLLENIKGRDTLRPGHRFTDHMKMGFMGKGYDIVALIVLALSRVH